MPNALSAVERAAYLLGGWGGGLAIGGRGRNGAIVGGGGRGGGIRGALHGIAAHGLARPPPPGAPTALPEGGGGGARGLCVLCWSTPALEWLYVVPVPPPLWSGAANWRRYYRPTCGSGRLIRRGSTSCPASGTGSGGVVGFEGKVKSVDLRRSLVRWACATSGGALIPPTTKRRRTSTKAPPPPGAGFGDQAIAAGEPPAPLPWGGLP